MADSHGHQVFHMLTAEGRREKRDSHQTEGKGAAEKNEGTPGKLENSVNKPAYHQQD